MAPVTIRSVVLKPSGWWVITDSQNVEYATRYEPWLLSLAKRCLEIEAPVYIQSVSGWHYRTITDMHTVSRPEAA